jgi:hypothetical protein
VRQAEPKAETAAPKQAAALNSVPRLIFPVLGQATFTDDYGDARGNGAHEGNDIMAPKRSLAVAAEAGTVRFAGRGGTAGCYLYLEKTKSKRTYMYVHLNNDLTTGNDNRGRCVPGVAYARGLRSGAKVNAGEPVGFVGDSGDANGVAPHLHFEVHPGGGAAVNPYPYLNRALRLLFAVGRGETFTLALNGTVVRAASGRLQVRVSTLRAWPGSYRFPGVNRTIEVAVPTTALIERRSDGVARTVSVPSLTSLTRRMRVEVRTPPAACTLAAQMGRAGALTASRIVILE